MYLKIFLFVLIIQTTLQAQKTATTSDDLPKYTIKTSVSSLLNPIKTSIQLATDVRLSPVLSADLSVGNYISSLQYAQYKGESIGGLNTKLGLKFHYNPDYDRCLYIGVEAKYQDIQNKFFQNVLRQGGAYSERMLIPRHFRTQGVASRTGIQFNLGEKRRFILDLYAGLGYAIETITTKIPKDAIPENNSLPLSVFQIKSGQRDKIYLVGGIHFGVAIW
jgi:hypothetical protein